MQYKNIEVHNIGKIREGAEPGSFRWYRVPEEVYEAMESEQGKLMCRGSTGVELRFVMKSDTVTLRMRAIEEEKGVLGVFHVYRGSIQGGWEDHEVNKNVRTEYADFVIKKSDNLEMLRKIAREFDQPFDPAVVRVIFDLGTYEIADIIGDVEPPRSEQLPRKTLLAYGSSITHGSNSIDTSHSWVSLLAHNLKVDCLNMGMAGSCRMEPAVVEHIAQQGIDGKWDIAVLELGINVLGWKKERILERVTHTLQEIAGRNPEKPVYVISPFYSHHDYRRQSEPETWRTLIEQVVNELQYSNVTYINGLEVLGDMSLISADEVHPNIYGMAQIAQRLTEIIKG